MSVIRKIPLLGWIGIAILLGILTGPIMPEWLGNTFLTYNSIFSGFLGFAVPLIILGLIMPAIGERPLLEYAPSDFSSMVVSPPSALPGAKR